MELITTALARSEMEILFPENLFFLEQAERPKEAPDGSLKKRFLGKRLECKAGNSSKKIE